MDAQEPKLLPALRDRRARRALSSQEVPESLQQLLWTAVSVAPSHGNSQPWRILVAKAPKVRAVLNAALSEGNKSWALTAPLLIGLAAIPAHASAKNYGADRALWSFDAGIATGNLLAQATAVGLVAHPMSSFDEDLAREALNVPSEVRILALVAIGFPGSSDSLPADLQEKESAPQDRLALENLVVVDKWGPEHSVNARELRK
jgi:nitroreductase